MRVILDAWKEAAGKQHCTAEQEKQVHLDTSGHQEVVHSTRGKQHSGMGA